MVYEGLMESIDKSEMHWHALNFLNFCMIGQWILNDAKPFLPQSQFFGIPPTDAIRWEHSKFSQIFPTQHMGMSGQQCNTPAGPQQRPKNHRHIPPLQMNTAGISLYQIYAPTIQELLTQSTMASVGSTQGSSQ